ncbi:MAG TPA: hypothetical protein VKV04_17920 [Verrucomicrobiae bacterium]|jgi:hypothetical protein|nr:hypothetical protein [Verrucomicrobiae bacterium]
MKTKLGFGLSDTSKSVRPQIAALLFAHGVKLYSTSEGCCQARTECGFFVN